MKASTEALITCKSKRQKLHKNKSHLPVTIKRLTLQLQSKVEISFGTRKNIHGAAATTTV